MGNRAGGGAGGGSRKGASPNIVRGVRVSGSRTPKIFGDVKVSDLKVGDVLQSHIARISPYEVKGIQKVTATTVDVGLQMKGSNNVRWERFGTDRYMGLRKVKK